MWYVPGTISGHLFCTNGTFRSELPSIYYSYVYGARVSKQCQKVGSRVCLLDCLPACLYAQTVAEISTYIDETADGWMKID